MRKRSGVTLLEILVAGVLFTLVIVALTRAFVSIKRPEDNEEIKTQGRNDLNELVTQIARRFQQRLTPRGGSDPNPSYSVQAAGGACGDLKIAYRHTSGSTETIEWMGFLNGCGGTCVDVQKFQADGTTVIAEVARYPKYQRLKATSLCVRDLGGQLMVEASATVRLGNIDYPLVAKRVLPSQEASRGVEFLPPN